MIIYTLYEKKPCFEISFLRLFLLHHLDLLSINTDTCLQTHLLHSGFEYRWGCRQLPTLGLGKANMLGTFGDQK